eukprot:5872636-Pyramimonas_sp.AAC.1
MAEHGPDELRGRVKTAEVDVETTNVGDGLDGRLEHAEAALPVVAPDRDQVLDVVAVCNAFGQRLDDERLGGHAQDVEEELDDPHPGVTCCPGNAAVTDLVAEAD